MPTETAAAAANTLEKPTPPLEAFQKKLPLPNEVPATKIPSQTDTKTTSERAPNMKEIGAKDISKKPPNDREILCVGEMGENKISPEKEQAVPDGPQNAAAKGPVGVCDNELKTPPESYDIASTETAFEDEDEDKPQDLRMAVDVDVAAIQKEEDASTRSSFWSSDESESRGLARLEEFRSDSSLSSAGGAARFEGEKENVVETDNGLEVMGREAKRPPQAPGQATENDKLKCSNNAEIGDLGREGPKIANNALLDERKPSPFVSLQRTGAVLGGALDDHEDDEQFLDEPIPTSALSCEDPLGNSLMTLEDIEICQKLDREYERALEEREVGWTAQYNSVRQSACFSITFMLLFLTLGTFFFQRFTKWPINDSLLFSIYTITTVGYGNHDIPYSPAFQTFTIFYIFLGIATLTIMVAQVYQCIALEATRAQYSRDKAEMAKRGTTLLNTNSSDLESGRPQSGPGRSGPDVHSGLSRTKTDPRTAKYISEFQEDVQSDSSVVDRILDFSVIVFEKSKYFFRFTEIGRGLSVLFPFAGLILIGAIVVGPIEGWTIVEALYFSVVSITTVGFGDYHPTQDASIWFCVFWLPFSVGFMSLFLGSVAHFYITLSNHNIHRLEKQMRRRIKRAKESAAREMEEARTRALKATGDTSVDFSDDDDEPPPGKLVALKGKPSRHMPMGFEALQEIEPDDEKGAVSRNRNGRALFGSPEAMATLGEKRRERIIKNSSFANYSDDETTDRPRGQTMTTMKAVIRAVHASAKKNQGKPEMVSSMYLGDDGLTGFEKEFMSMRSSGSIEIGKRKQTKPPFALRVLVQERLAEIIATDIAGYQSHVEIKENTLSVTVESLKLTADKWLIPRRARKAFRAVAFESLYFAGEHGLITRGADALYDLTPFEFHGLFGPLLAAMGDAETMEGWIASTSVLADVDLRRDTTRPQLRSIANTKRHLMGDSSDENPPRRTGKQTEKLGNSAERQMKKASDVAPRHTFRRNVAGNAFSNKR